MNFADNLTFLANYAGQAAYATDPNFLAQLPIIIRSGEQRILRDMDLLSTRVTQTGALTLGSRVFTLPSNGAAATFNVVETVRLKMDRNGLLVGTQFTQPALLPVSVEYLDAVFPDDHPVGAPSIPEFWAPYADNQIIVGRSPGQSYPVVVYGTQDPAPLSVSNTETWISINLPDLFIAAEMIDTTMWQRQFGMKADQAQGAIDWNAEYERLFKTANVQELRRFVESSGWGTAQPNPLNPAPT